MTPSTAGVAGPIVPSTLKEGPATQPNPPRRAPEGPLASLPLPCPKAEPLQYHGFKCPECHSQFTGAAELAAHFQEVKAESSSVSPHGSRGHFLRRFLLPFVGLAQ